MGSKSKDEDDVREYMDLGDGPLELSFGVKYLEGERNRCAK